MPTESADEGIRNLNEWALAELERTRRAYEATTSWLDPAEREKSLALVNFQIANLREKLGLS